MSDIIAGLFICAVMVVLVVCSLVSMDKIAANRLNKFDQALVYSAGEDRG